MHDIKTTMNISPIRKNFISYSLLAVFSFFINYYFANLGLHPIDTFSFFESGYLITQGYHPVKFLGNLRNRCGLFTSSFFFSFWQ